MKTFNALLLALLFAVPALAEEQESYGQAELDQMLAPIALYPDTVLSHVLIAATYPLEVVQAYRWTQANPGLEGEAAVAAVEHQDWDPSVKALVAFPDLLGRMHDDLEWTQRLGEAFLMQEGDVIATVQGLRQRAYAAGNLASNEHVQVVREREIIYVEPARPNIVYVPYYDPRVVYGPWWWSAHPPVYWAYPPGFHVGVTYYWGPGYRVVPSWFYISSFHWTRRQVVVVHTPRYRPRPVFHSGRAVVRHDNARRWQHNPTHRRGVSYRAPRLDQQYTRPGRYGQGPAVGQRPTGQRPAQQRPATQRDWAAERRREVSFRDTPPMRAGASEPEARIPRARQRPATAQTQQRPATAQQRPQAQRPATAQTQQRPATAQQRPQAQRPATAQTQQRPQVQSRPAPVQQQRPQVQSRPAPVQRQRPQVQSRPAPVQQQRPQVQSRPAPVQQQRPQVQSRPAPVQQQHPQVQSRPAAVRPAAPAPAARPAAPARDDSVRGERQRDR